MGFLKRPMGKYQNKSSRSSYKLTKPHGSLSTKPKSLTQLAAENLEQSMKRPAVSRKPSKLTPTLKTLAAKALVKDKINYWENKITNNAPIIALDKIAVSLQEMRDEELKRARVSKYQQQSSFQNLFHERLEQMPGKRERAQITINTVIEHTIDSRTEFTDKTYGPFKMEVPKLSEPDMYKFLMYTLLQNNFTVLSTETIAESGADIFRHIILSSSKIIKLVLSN